MSRKKGMPMGEQKALAATLTEHVWERRLHEGPRAWEAFQLFRDMGAGRRMRDVIKDLAISPEYMYGVARKYDWGLRVAAFDKHLEDISLAAFEEEAKLMGQRHARLGMKMQGLAAERLEAYSVQPELKDTVTIQEASRLAKEGVEIERTARGERANQKEGGSITFNLIMGGMPKWAPKQLAVRTVEAEVVDGDGNGEGTVPSID